MLPLFLVRGLFVMRRLRSITLPGGRWSLRLRAVALLRYSVSLIGVALLLTLLRWLSISSLRCTVWATRLVGGLTMRPWWG